MNTLKTCTTTLLFVLLSTMSFGQAMYQVLRGTIKDQVSENPLPGAKVIILNTDPVLGAVSDQDGFFELKKVPLGRHDIVISYMGYEDVVLRGINLNAGKEKVLNISLVEKIVEHEGVEVVANAEGPINDMLVVSTQSFTVEETQKYAAAVNDPARMATSFAGVVGTEGTNNDISIRGNSPRGLVWRMEGMDIPNPNHFAGVGTSGGGISIISAQLLGNSDFSTGAFSAEYGNALSGVFDLSLRKGNNQKREYTLQAGVLGIDAAMEGPFKKGYNGSYLVNYRYSTLGLLGQIVPIGDEVTIFQDLSYNVYLPTKKLGNFAFFGFGGLSNAVYEAERDTSIWIEEPNKQYEGSFKANTGVVGAWHKGRVGERGMIKTNIAFSGVKNSDVGDSLDHGFLKHREYNDFYVQSKFTISTTYSQKVSSRLNFKTGVVFNQLGYNVLQESGEAGGLVPSIKQKGATNTVQAFFQSSYRLSEKLTFNLGAHYLQLFLNNTKSLEPRAALSYRINNKHSLSLGYGSHSQIQPLGTYFTQTSNANGQIIEPNRNLDLSKAHHAVLSYNLKVNANNKLKVELYYQDLYNVPISADETRNFSLLNTSEGFSSSALVSSGKGKNYGAEISLDRSLQNNFYYLMAVSIFESKYKAHKEKWFDTRYNTKFSVNITGGKEWLLKNQKKRRTVGLNIKSVLVGGMRYTPYDMNNYSGTGVPALDTERSFSASLPLYYRLNVKISIKRDYKNMTSTLALDMQNALNWQNVGGQYFNVKSGEVEYWYNPGILPILSYTLNF